MLTSARHGIGGSLGGSKHGDPPTAVNTKSTISIQTFTALVAKSRTSPGFSQWWCVDVEFDGVMELVACIDELVGIHGL